MNVVYLTLTMFPVCLPDSAHKRVFHSMLPSEPSQQVIPRELRGPTLRTVSYMPDENF